MSLIERLNNEETIPLEYVPALVNEFTAELARMQAALAENDAEIVRLKHELKQDEYKFIRNHDDYHKELVGLRGQNEKLQKDRDQWQAAAQLNNGTYERQQREIAKLQADLDRVLGEAVWAMESLECCPPYLLLDSALSRIQVFLKSRRARRGKIS